LHKIIYTI